MERYASRARTFQVSATTMSIGDCCVPMMSTSMSPALRVWWGRWVFGVDASHDDEHAKVNGRASRRQSHRPAARSGAVPKSPRGDSPLGRIERRVAAVPTVTLVFGRIRGSLLVRYRPTGPIRHDTIRTAPLRTVAHRGWPTMSDPLTWSPIPLGRWFGTTVRVHIFLIVFVVFRLLDAAVAPTRSLTPAPTACWLALLLLALAVHELGHRVDRVAGLRPRGCPPLAAGQPGRPVAVDRSSHSALVALAGPLTGALSSWSSRSGSTLHRGSARLESVRPGTRPRRSVSSAGPRRPHPPGWIGWFGYLNCVLLLVNLLPALPFDGGRMLHGTDHCAGRLGRG